ncbi:TAXI family TRAP transporter solute-binding subunit [Microbacterium sp. NPDC090225]|uniref:TAXI family TRAP transporter solute-binding subunit n=1 Tax=Microbacterium sp. NPDC090225 TaxID=3364207 RepID=UPI00382293B5
MTRDRMLRLVRSVAAAICAMVVVVGASGCSARAAEWAAGTTVIAGGGTTGVYFDYGGHLADELAATLGISAEVTETDGSVDNLRRVASGEALLGFAQGDAAADAVAGRGAFDAPLPIRAAARLYDEYVHVVVRADSDIDAITDLAGRTVSLGAVGSGVNVIATRILDAARVDDGAVSNPQLDLRESIAALESGEIDGFFWVGGLPTPGIENLSGSLPLRLLPIEQDWVNDINARYSDAYRPSDFPAGAYGIARSVPTMAVPNYLIVATATPDAVVRDVLTVLFDARSRMAEDVPAAALLSRRQAIFTVPVELHPGAVDFYRDQRG